jgi:hypothetical protein
MNEEESRNSLLRIGFTEKQIEHLRNVRRNYVEKEQLVILKEQRRLEFARWLVMNNRLTDHAA